MHSRGNLEYTLGVICSVFDAYSVVVFLPDPDSETCHLAAKFSLGDHILNHFELTPGKGLAGWILKNRQPLRINNFDRNRSRLGYYDGKQEDKIRAFMGCPLPDGGVLCVDNIRSQAFSEKDQKLLHLFTGMIEDMRCRNEENEAWRCQEQLYDRLHGLMELHHKEPRWEPFIRRFGDMLAECAGFPKIFLAVRAPDGEQYFLEYIREPLVRDDRETLYPLAAGLVGWVFRQGQSLCYPEKTGGEGAPLSPLFGKGKTVSTLRSVLLEPILFGKKTRAVLGLASEDAPRITRELKMFVRMAAEHLAILFENLYLRSKVQEANEQLEAIQDSFLEPDA